MKKDIKTINSVSLLVILIFVFLLGYITHTVEIIENRIDIESYNITDLETAFKDGKELYEPLYRSVSDSFREKHTYISKEDAIKYNKSEYVCRHYARDIGEILEAVGYDVVVETGRIDGSDTQHAINVVKIAISNGYVENRDFFDTWTTTGIYTIDEFKYKTK